MRKDIQALRGIAVLLVIAYHARLGMFGRGFLGVDVFFVVSGFLITGMISRELDTGRFSFAKFYWRRSKRLLPAAYVVFIATSLAAIMLLTRLELKNFRAQAFGAVTFSANWFLSRQGGYFGGEGDLKPLLHTWSLSMEEQFYLIFPALLWLTPARFRKALVAVLLLGSLTACLTIATKSPSRAFYALPARAWELMLGAVGALWIRARAPRAGVVTSVASVVGLAVILVLSSVTLDPVHPRLDALLVCLATLTVIWAQSPILDRGPASRILSAVGDRSYSLYLVHWPLFAFANHVYLNDVPMHVRLGIVVVSIVASAILYWGVERPIHLSTVRPSLRWVLVASVIPLLIVGLPHVTLRATPSAQYWLETMLPNMGLSAQCEYDAKFTPLKSCETSTNPKILVWGDSMAMHLVPGLAAASSALGIRQATKSACGPIAGIATESHGGAWAQTCLEFNDSVLNYIEHNPSILYVVLSSQFSQYFSNNATGSLRTREGLIPAGSDVVFRAFLGTIEQVRKYGKKVVIVAPPPATDVDFAHCVERKETGLLMAGHLARAGCEIPKPEYLAKAAPVIALLKTVSAAANVTVIWPSDFFCGDTQCRTSEGGIPLYRDAGHLTREGSILFAKQTGLFDKVIAGAR